MHNQLVILKTHDANLPTSSCDLTTLEYFLWGYMKNHINKNNSELLPELKKEIVRVIIEIHPQIYKNFIENFNYGIDVCRDAYIIFRA